LCKRLELFAADVSAHPLIASWFFLALGLQCGLMVVVDPGAHLRGFHPLMRASDTLALEPS